MKKKIVVFVLIISFLMGSIVLLSPTGAKADPGCEPESNYIPPTSCPD